MHHNFDDSDSGYDVDVDQKLKSFGGNQRGSGRIILLGDGSEVLTDSDDTEMFDHGEEDKDLDSQAPKSQSKSESGETPAVVPDKVDNSDPKIKAVADNVKSDQSEK